jgi:hypothetical protein
MGTTFKDANGDMITLHNFLKILTDRIESLEEQISYSKGELVVKLFDNNRETTIANGASVNVSVVAENYAELITGATRTYYNRIYSIEDYYVEFKNVAKSSQLGLLSYRTYQPDTGTNNFFNFAKSHGALATYVDSYDMMNAQVDNQFIYIEDTSGGYNIYHSGNTAGELDYGNVTSDGGGVLESNWNLGISGYTDDGGLTLKKSEAGIYADPVNVFGSNDTGSIVGPVYWSGTTDLLCTVHPYFENIIDFVYTDGSGEKIIDPQQSFIVPIKIFFQLCKDFVDETTTFEILSNESNSISKNKKLRFFIEPANLSRAFEFEIVFRIYRNRTYNVRTTGTEVRPGL